MTRIEFEGATPFIIEHSTFGIGYRYTQADRDGDKIAGYKHTTGGNSGGCIAKSWLEVYEQMQVYLKRSKELKVII